MKEPAVKGFCLAILLSAVAAFVTAAAVFIAAYLLFPLNGIEVSGTRMYPESEVSDFVSQYSSLLTLNTRMLEQEVESNPWVESARVRKVWESSIVAVEVEERSPILYGEVDGRRVILSGDGEELPGLGGEDLSRVELDGDQVSSILEAARVFEDNGARFGSVDGVGPGGVEATVGGRSVIFSGSVGAERARALVDLMEDHPEVSLFDLRSPDRVIVRGDGGDGESEG